MVCLNARASGSKANGSAIRNVLAVSIPELKGKDERLIQPGTVVLINNEGRREARTVLSVYSNGSVGLNQEWAPNWNSRNLWGTSYFIHKDSQHLIEVSQ